MDLIREIGNIGAGNAATALSDILGRRIVMSVPEVKIIPLSAVPQILGEPDAPVVGGMVSMSGGLTGQILLVFGIREAYILASIMCGRDTAHTDNIDVSVLSDLDLSALYEVTNILAGSYLSAISKLTGLSILPSIPNMSIDMAGAILSLIAVECGKVGDSALFFEARFIDAEDDMTCSFLLLPDEESYEKLMLSLGVS
jgi:chemotaxis protein CheC